MKKLISLALAIVFCLTLILSLASCSTRTFETFNDASPEELYALSLESIREMDNFTIVHEQEITATVFLFIKESVTNTITIQVDGDDFYQKLDNEEDIWDDDIILETWYVDEYLYGVTSGALRKQHFNPSVMAGSAYDFDNLDGTLLDLPEEYLKNSKFHAKKGDVYLEFEIDGDKYYDMLLNSGGDTEFAGKADGDVRYRVYFHDDGTVDRIQSYFKCTITAEGMDIKTEIKITSTVTEVDTTEIKLPQAAANAQEGDWFRILR